MQETSIPRGIRKRYGRWEYRFMVQGRTYTNLTDYVAIKRNLRAVEKLRANHRAEVLAMEEPPSGPVRFSKAADDFIRWSMMEHRSHPNSARRQAVSMTSLKAFFSHKTLDQVTAGDLDRFKTWRRECDIKDITIRHDLHAASQLFQYGQRSKWCSSNPVQAITIPSDEESRNEKTLSEAEEIAYFREAVKHGVLFDVGRLMILQGLRPGEALALRTSVIDLDSKTLTITHGKSKAARRTLDLTAESCVILGRRLASGSNWVFPGKMGPKQFSYSGLVNAHNRALRHSGTSFDIYSLRHTFATRFYAATKDIVALRRILGHRDLKTIMRYIHDDGDQIRSAMRLYEESTSPIWNWESVQ